MPTSIARVTPTDYDAWHAVHMEVVQQHGKEVGMISEVIYRDHDDPRTVVAVQQIESIARIQEFFASPYMQERIAEAPIESPPVFWFLDEVEVLSDIPAMVGADSAAATPSCTSIGRLTPTDYDAWHNLHMRVLREHGVALGVLSEVIYRDHEDPTAIVLVAQVESVERMAAFYASPEFAAIVQDAPIAGEPTQWLLDEVEGIADISALAKR